MSTLPFTFDTTLLLIIITGLLALLTLFLLILLVIMGKLLKQSKKACQDSNYISQKIPVWIKEGITESVKPELDKVRRVFENYAETVGDSQVEALEEVIDRFVAELNKKVEESASQYTMRIAQSAEQFNRSLADINSTVSVTLTNALGGFDSELQATLTELLNTMKKLRSVTNNIPKVIDNSFAEMQRSFDEMETEMQHTIAAFRDMRIKIEAQQNALGPVQPGMLRNDVMPQRTIPAITQQQNRTVSAAASKATETVVQTSEAASSVQRQVEKPSGGMNFSNY